MKKHILYLAALLLAGTTSFAQAGNVWKKTVYRTLDLGQKEDTAKHHLTDVTTDTTLLEIIANSIKAGKLVAYANFDHSFTTKFSIVQLKELMGNKIDTTIVVDPVNNKEKQIIVRHPFNFDAIHKYRLLEEWSFDPATGKTDIRIDGIAPLREIYGDDGNFRGVQAMFWLRYADAHQVIARYDKIHPTKTFASLIWDDYFLSEVKPSAEK